MELTKELVLEYLKTQSLMVLATYGEEPWVASVYYTFDSDLNLYYLSAPQTLHCLNIEKNPSVAAAIVDSNQNVNTLKRGIQLNGVAHQISEAAKVRHALELSPKANTLGLSRH